MRIALIAPPFIAVPPRGYGGTELFIAELASGLAEKGIDLTLYANGESSLPVSRKWIYEKQDWPLECDTDLNLKLLDHAAWAVRDATGSADIIHLNSPPALPLVRFSDVPAICTLHHAYEPALADFYGRFPEVFFVTISHSQRKELKIPKVRTIHHGIDLSKYRYQPNKQDYLCFLGRVAPPKGTHLAIDIAREAGIPLKIAGEIQPLYREYWERRVKPHVDGRFIEYVGEVGLKEKNELLGNARALLFPSQWNEPFGLVLVEAMACGTPVLAMPGGSVEEIVKEGVSGYVRESVRELASCAGSLHLEPAAMRRYASALFSRERMVNDYIALYRWILRGKSPERAEPVAA